MAGKVSRVLPGTRLVDGTLDTEAPRTSGYGEPYVLAYDVRQSADEGSYFVARNATPGTGVVGHAAPTTHDTEKAFIMLENGSESLRVTLDYIKLHVTAAGTGGTVNYATHTVDKNRTYSSGGENLTIVNVNLLGSQSSVLTTAKIGAVVPGQANTTNAVIVAHQRLRTVIPVVGDIIFFNFGGVPVPSGAVLGGTTELERGIQCPPIVLGPGHSYHLVLWRASQSAAASYECEIGFWQR
jgi:hypothetical protein